MSQSDSQYTLELDEAQTESTSEPDVDDNQTALCESAGDEDGGGLARSANESSGGSSSQGDSLGLEEFGVEDDPSPHNPRLDNPDGDLEEDRRTNTRVSTDETEQEALFPDIDNKDQVTLTGDRAYNQCLFED